MLKRFIIFGILLFLVGAAELGWITAERRKDRVDAASCKLKYGSEPDEYLKKYNDWLQLSPADRAQTPFTLGEHPESKTRAQLRKEQQERLKADLDKLAAGEIDANPFADVLYGENWRAELSRYKQRKERSEFVFTGSVVCTSIGGTISAWCLLAWIVRRIVARLPFMQKLFPGVSADEVMTEDFPTKGQTELHESDSQEEHQVQTQRSQVPRRIKVPLSSAQPGSEGTSEPVTVQADRSVKSEVRSDRRDRKNEKVLMGNCGAKNTEKVSSLLSDGKCAGTGQALGVAVEDPGTEPEPRALPSPKASKTTASLSDRDSDRLQESLRTQTEHLEKQMVELKRMAQSVRQTTIEHSQPLNKTLEDLTQQVSAIREYAASQQERVAKLQSGYDWSIIRTFCLRVIRCIDNLENRIDVLSKQKTDAADLKEVRDELIFALESSGVEQFRPEINSEYRGQEKHAEAVKGREHCVDPKQVGRIAKVVRPGYHYFVDDNNIKIVRMAQVKLFG